MHKVLVAQGREQFTRPPSSDKAEKARKGFRSGFIIQVKSLPQTPMQDGANHIKAAMICQAGNYWTFFGFWS
jgi:hypothetical protein